MGEAMISQVDNTLQVVEEDVEYFFDQAAPLLQKALKYADGELTVWDIKRLIGKGLMQLWLGVQQGEVETVMVTEIADYPAKRIVRVVALAGRISPYLHVFEMIKEWAVVNGAVELEAWCRPAMSRLLRRYGFSKRHEIVRCDLRRYWQ